MRLIYADYNMQTNSIDITTFQHYILRIDCNKAEEGLRVTPRSQYALNTLALDNPIGVRQIGIGWRNAGLSRDRRWIYNVRKEASGVEL